MNENEIITIKNVTKTYKNGTEESIVIDNISLSINESDFIAIVGPSGSGKSKLMHLIGGLDSSTNGEILYKGVNINKLKDKEIAKYRRETIGFIFQDFNLDGYETVLNNIMLPMVFSGVKLADRKQKAMECLEKVNLSKKAKSKANELSGGQKQKVAIARALANNPKILLADEPTGNLDTKSGQEIMDLLKGLNKNGYTIIMVTHNIEQANQAKRIVKIQDGKLLKDELNPNFSEIKSKSEKGDE